MIRSTWDYVERLARFATWLDELEANDVVVHNPLPLLRWNLSKRYSWTSPSAAYPPSRCTSSPPGLELVEPELFFRLDPTIAARLARIVTRT